MSFFGNWTGGQQQGPAPVEIAKLEIDAQIDFFQKMALACSKKCIVKHTDGELSVGEMSCIDRCSNKYMQAREIVIETNRLAEQRMIQMQNAGAPPPQMFK